MLKYINLVIAKKTILDKLSIGVNEYKDIEIKLLNDEGIDKEDNSQLRRSTFVGCKCLKRRFYQLHTHQYRKCCKTTNGKEGVSRCT